MHWCRKLLFSSLVVVLQILNPPKYKRITSLHLRDMTTRSEAYIFIQNAWKVRFLCNIYQNLWSQFSVMRWRTKLLFVCLIVLLQICKPPTISFLARCMCEICSFKVRYIFYNAWKVSFLCNISSKICGVISPRCGDIETCYLAVWH